MVMRPAGSERRVLYPSIVAGVFPGQNSIEFGGISVPLFLRSPGQVGGGVVVVSIWY